MNYKYIKSLGLAILTLCFNYIAFAHDIVVNNKTDESIDVKGLLFSQNPQVPPAQQTITIEKHGFGTLNLNVEFPIRLLVTAEDKVGHRCSLQNYVTMSVIKIDRELICYPG